MSEKKRNVAEAQDFSDIFSFVKFTFGVLRKDAPMDNHLANK